MKKRWDRIFDKYVYYMDWDDQLIKPTSCLKPRRWDIYSGKLHFLTSLLSALVASTRFTPFSIEITQPGLPGSGVH